jgi:signal transduction histidine kinase/DNA-binding response OmpR family regulator
MKYFLYIICCFLSFHVTPLQAQRDNDLGRAVVYAQTDTQRIRLLIELVDNTYEEKSWPKYNEQAFEIGTRLSQDANPEIQLKGKRYLADAINNRGYLTDNQGDYNGALIQYFEALKIREEIGYQQGIASSYNNIGAVFQKQNDLIRALDYYEKSYRIRSQNGDKGGMARSLNHIGEIYRMKEDYDTALSYIQQSLELSRAANVYSGVSEALLNISDIHILAGKYDLAQKCIKESLVYLYQLNSTKGLLAANIKLGTIKIEEKKYAEAIALALQQLKIAKENKFLEEESSLYSILNKAYEKQGDLSKAYAYYKQYIELREGLKKQNKGVLEQQYQYEYGKKEAENQAKQNEKDLRGQFVRNALLASCLALFLFVGILMNRNFIRQKANEELAEKNRMIEEEKQKAEQSERYKTQFLSNISHEIRTPMNAILGMSDLLVATNVNEQQLRYINAIKKSSENLSLVINDVLDFSKIEAGKVELEIVPFRPRDVVEDVYNTLKFKAEEKGLDFKLNIDPIIAPILWGDNFRLYQILMNLVGNAIKFTEKGSVSIEISLLESSGTSQMIRYQVKDTGVGIAPEKMSTIFNSFQQAEQSTTRRYGGTGLGLSIAQQLVKLRNSEIHVESELDKGSIFYFDLYNNIANEEELAQYSLKDKVVEHSEFKGIKILLAEDNEYNQIVAVESLIRYLEDCEIQVANNGKEVITLLERSEYDIVLMDLSMPEMDGYEATAYIRNNFEGAKAQIPIIALTAFAFEGEEKCLEAGMNAYITKPFKINHLLNLMSAFVVTKNKKNGSENKNESTSANVNTGILNLSFIEDFTENDKEQTKYFIEKFINNIPKEIAMLQAAFRSNNHENIRKAAHTFKPQIEFVGIVAALETIKNMEQKAIEKKDMALLEQDFNALVQQIDIGSITLKEYILKIFS